MQDLDALRSLLKGGAGPKPEELVHAVECNPTSAGPWWELAASLEASGSLGPAEMARLYSLATRAVPRQGNQGSDAYMRLWLAHARCQWCASRFQGGTGTPDAAAPPAARLGVVHQVALAFTVNGGLGMCHDAACAAGRQAGWLSPLPHRATAQHAASHLPNLPLSVTSPLPPPPARAPSSSRHTDRQDAMDILKALRRQSADDPRSLLFYEWAALESRGGDARRAGAALDKGLRDRARPAGLLEAARAELDAGAWAPLPLWRQPGAGGGWLVTGPIPAQASSASCLVTPGIDIEQPVRSGATLTLVSPASSACMHACIGCVCVCARAHVCECVRARAFVRSCVVGAGGFQGAVPDRARSAGLVHCCERSAELPAASARTP